MTSLLLVDDDRDAVTSLGKALASSLRNPEIFVASTSDAALEACEKEKPEVAVIDLCLEPSRGVESGFELLQRLQAIDRNLRIIVLTGHGDTTFGIRAMKLGAVNFLVKPADIPHLSALIHEGARQYQLMSELDVLSQGDVNRQMHTELVGSSQAIIDLRQQLHLAGSTTQPILLEGETGVGKSLCARLIHRISQRAKNDFIRYQPGLSRSDVLASELFGHERGAFTGADSARDGLIRSAHGGTFFLDEIEGLPVETQTALLGVLQDKRYRKLGADKVASVDIRFISATNGDVDMLVRDGVLRKDFFHRIAYERIQIPPLRDRREDIPMLVKAYLQKLQENEEVGFHHVLEEALDELQMYSWPGNIRELEAAIQSAAARAAFAGRSEILPQDFTLLQKAESRSHSAGVLGSSSKEQERRSLQEQVALFKRERVEGALKESDGNQMQAARLLGIDRTTLRRILQG